MDELIPLLEKLLDPHVPKDQRDAAHQQVYNALVSKLNLSNGKGKEFIKKVMRLVGKKKYQEAKAAIMAQDKKSSHLILILILIALLLLLAFLWYTGRW